MLWLTSLAALLPACLGWLCERPSTVVHDSSKDRTRVFACAFATCAVSVTVGSLQAFSTFSDNVQGVSTIVLGVLLATTIHSLLKPVSRDLAGAAVYIFLSGALQPATDVMFAWFHADGRLRRPVAFSDGNAVDATRLHLTMKWVVSSSILSALRAA